MTLTYTRARRRSGVTSAPVTVTNPMILGSLALSERKVATSSRIAAPTRSARLVLRSGGRREGSRHLLLSIRFDTVADLDVVEVLYPDPAFEAFANFAHIVLDTPQ